MVLGLAWMVACTGADVAPSVPPDPVAAPAVQAAPVTGDVWLVWSGVDDVEETVWIDASGQVLHREKGVFVYAGGHLWGVQSHTVKIPSIDCECVAETDPTYVNVPDTCKRQADTEVLEVVDRLAPTQRIELVSPPKPGGEGEGDIGGDTDPGIAATIIGQVGDSLFVETSGYAFGCGAAHGSGWIAYDIYDLSKSTKTTVTPVSESEKQAIVTSDAARAAGKAQGEDVFDPAQYELTEVRPRWQVDGALAMQAQLTWGACYACSDGLWGAYSRSARLPMQVPGVFKAHAQAPGPVVAYWSGAAGTGGTLPGERAGWSVAPASTLYQSFPLEQPE